MKPPEAGDVIVGNNWNTSWMIVTSVRMERFGNNKNVQYTIVYQMYNDEDEKHNNNRTLQLDSLGGFRIIKRLDQMELLTHTHKCVRALGKRTMADD